ncbi:Thioesterase/thiol ester dehydrase-isomerase [Dendrothele bispora CBS 962.96]|uniref:Thioesterase/thiol ester dehydrase-isomerase n=1 Tax=Dendrothele bispora (strain CBS 962.96) TaxID=1314807 RepID=A0A4S8LAE0_DENBC|nr:Thioesterase/thiol ester dehydrase-isomerase [Dendrothele bispora CBS 962.96]
MLLSSGLRFVLASKPCLGSAVSQCQSRLSSSSIKRLQDAFRDPSSPYYLAPGEQGPASPDEKPVSESPQESINDFDALLEKGKKEMSRAGFHIPFIWQQVVEWGDHDAFQHVNNVRYVRYFENSRINWMTCLGNRLGGPAKADALLKGKGISLIMKSIEVKYRRPVTFPDTLLISHRPTKSPNDALDPATCRLSSSAYSVRQQAFVAHCNESVVWYDYDNLRKCFPGQEYIDAMWEHFLEE